MLLWFVLKVIGLILLVLCCLFSLLIALILLVPIRYEAGGFKKNGDPPEMECHGDIHWLFHLVQLHAEISENTKRADVRILWLHPLNPKKRKESAEKKQEIKRTTVSHRDESDPQSARMSASKDAAQKNEAERQCAGETSPITEAAAKDGTEKLGAKRSSAEAPREAKATSHKIKKIFRAVPDRIKKICEKGSAFRALLTDEENQEAIRLIVSRARYLLHHLGFRKLKGELTAGFDDPAMMGRIMGVASLFYPLFSDSFSITPVFDHSVCEGWFQLKGHIRLIHIVLVLLQLLLNKKIRHAVFQYR